MKILDNGYWTGLALSGLALVLWSLSPFCFAAMGRRVGPFTTNLMRLGLATVALLTLVGLQKLFGFSYALPGPVTFFWLVASGIIGLVFGDFFLYRALATEGPEKTSQVQTLAPAASAILAWVFLREFLSGAQVGGMALILTGVSFATWEAARKRNSELSPRSLGDKKISLPKAKSWSHLLQGTWAALWSSLLQGLGTVLARHAFLAAPELNPIIATTIRVSSASLVIWTVARIQGPIGPILKSCRQRRVLQLLLTGTLVGPLLGMLCYVSALKYSPAGIVTTLTFMTPLIVIPLGSWYYGTRIGVLALIGTGISLAGVILLGFG